MPPSAASAAVPDAAQVQTLVSFLEHEAQPMIVLDLDYRILAANRAYQPQFVSREGSVVGRHCFAVSHGYDTPCDRNGEHCPLRRALHTRAPDRVLHIHHTPRGPEHVDVELRPLLDHQGRVTGFVERLGAVRQAQARPGAGLVGRSTAFGEALAAVRRVAPSQLPVLLQGESGTGKELFARAVHEASPRSEGPFVVVDCSGLTETLFESELFGHERGAFTGANVRKKGLVETAHGGTLFLDEIGDVPLGMQVKLLRLIETGTYRRVGGVETLQADFRLVAATHQPLQTMVAEGRFRADLYWRISAFPIVLPPLRERMEDLPLLVESLLGRGAGRAGVALAPAALQALRSHAWPGNIRELRNVLERARLFADDGVIRPEHLPPQIVAATCAAPDPSPLPSEAPQLVPSPGAPATPKRPQAVSDDDLRALAAIGTRRELARRLGWSERTLYRRLRALPGA